MNTAWAPRSNVDFPSPDGIDTQQAQTTPQTLSGSGQGPNRRAILIWVWLQHFIFQTRAKAAVTHNFNIFHFSHSEVETFLRSRFLWQVLMP